MLPWQRWSRSIGKGRSKVWWSRVYGYSAPCERIEIVEAAHPVPDDAGMKAARRMLDYVSDLTKEDEVLCLISGGGSALLSLPLDGIKP